MDEHNLKRHLAAILAGDVAGYSRLMASDERATVIALDVARGVIRTHIESNQGRVIDMVGDAVLAAFDTAVGAVNAAMAIQKELNTTAAATAVDRRMHFRIGIHLGDVIEKSDGTLYGDGVNIAARLESLADHGGITVSSMVQEVVRNRVTVSFVDMGEHEVKNIPYPVRAYRIAVEGSTPAPAKPKAAGEGGIDSILDQRDHLEKLLKQKFKRHLAVMFTGLKDSTALAERDMSGLEMFKRYHDVVARAVRDNDGTLVKTMGDGTLSYFPEAQRALRAAVKIQRSLDELNLGHSSDALLLARVGVHTGDCFLEKDDVFGDVVTTASSIEGAANPGEIFISEDTFRALSDKAEVYCRHHQALSVKGKNQSVNVHKAFWDPTEAEKDQMNDTVVVGESQSPLKPARPAWKLAAMLGIPIVIVLVISLVASNREKLDTGSHRSVTQTLPGK